MATKQIDLRQLMARADLLKQRLASLNVLIAEVRTALSSFEIGLETLAAVKNGGKVLVPGDPGFNIIIRSSIIDNRKVLYHIGGQIYVVLDIDTAAEKLSERISSTKRALAELELERKETLSELSKLEYAIQYLIAVAQQVRKQESRNK